MGSFTSSSDGNAATSIKWLCAIVIVLLLAAELSARLFLPAYSSAYFRVMRQHGRAVQSRRSPGEPLSVLIVGNSLLLDGIDVDRMRKAASPELEIYPVFLEGTHYYDWLYGLRRLFRDGARPSVVVVGLGMESLLQNSVLPESPMLLFDGRGILDVSADLKLDRTATFNLLAAHWSVFWGGRRVIRLNVLRRIVPGARDLFALLHKMPGSQIGPTFEAVATARLSALRQLGETYGARVVLLIPPWSTSPAAIPQTLAAARHAGVQTVMPVDPLTLPATLYEPDRVHLNARGAAVFTTALERELPRQLVAANTPACSRSRIETASH